MYSFCVHECVVTYFYLELIIVIGPVVDCGEGPVGPRYLTTTNAVSSILAIPRKPKLTEYAEEKKTEAYPSSLHPYTSPPS